MEVVFRAISAYLILLAMLRIKGRRQGKRMTSFEILLIFMLGGQMTQSILREDRSFGECLHWSVNRCTYAFAVCEAEAALRVRGEVS
jgi:uncharacterized membrane protein YcaP (DUF421 family)